MSEILDSGERREFESGAVRDISDGKGRMDLLPLDVVADFFDWASKTKDDTFCNVMNVTRFISEFMNSGDPEYIYKLINSFMIHEFLNKPRALIELSIHYEQGAKKYAERNWEKGINCHCYIDSALRHYFKYWRGDEDEPHNRAFLWNLFCLLWTVKHRPKCNDLPYNEVKLTEEVAVTKNDVISSDESTVITGLRSLCKPVHRRTIGLFEVDEDNQLTFGIIDDDFDFNFSKELERSNKRDIISIVTKVRFGLSDYTELIMVLGFKGVESFERFIAATKVNYPSVCHEAMCNVIDPTKFTITWADISPEDWFK